MNIRKPNEDCDSQMSVNQALKTADEFVRLKNEKCEQRKKRISELRKNNPEIEKILKNKKVAFLIGEIEKLIELRFHIEDDIENFEIAKEITESFKDESIERYLNSCAWCMKDYLKEFEDIEVNMIANLLSMQMPEISLEKINESIEYIRAKVEYSIATRVTDYLANELK